MFKKRKPAVARLTRALLASAVGATAFAAMPAFAGGLSAGTSAANNFYVWYYSILGILAGCYLGYKGMLAWTDREHWSDFGAGVLKVSVVGAVGVLAPWAWGLWVN
jgi:hypothetical protein